MRHKTKNRTSKDVKIISNTVDFCDHCGPACERTIHAVPIGDKHLTLCRSKVVQFGFQDIAVPLDEWPAAPPLDGKEAGAPEPANT